jgi:hypothetical protein
MRWVVPSVNSQPPLLSSLPLVIVVSTLQTALSTPGLSLRHTVAVLSLPLGLEVGRDMFVALVNVADGFTDLLAESLSPLRRDRKLGKGVVGKWSSNDP